MVNISLESMVKYPLFNLGWFLSIGLATTGSVSLLASRLETSSSPKVLPISTAQASPSNSLMDDGTYLYGQSSEPNRIGQQYLVFKIHQGKLVGAFYMPRSEFSCFYGTLKPQKMDLTVVAPYEDATHPYVIALEEKSPVAAAGGQPPRSLGLQGYERIQPLSENDKRILNTCLSEHKQEVWN